MMTIPNPEPLVAVILVAYGGRDDTLVCITSLLKSDYPNYKIILVDNASWDDTSEQVAAKFPDVEIIYSDKNLGFAGGNNLGMDRALEIGAQYIFLLNNDTEIAPDAISCLVESAEARENIGVIGPMIYYHEDSSLIWSAGGNIDYAWSNLYHRGIRTKNTKEYSILEEVDYLTGCAIMFPAKRVLEVGKLDESYWMYYEDADFCQRIKTAGYSVMFEPGAKVWHKVSSSTGGNLAPRKMFYKFNSGYRFFMRYSPSPFWFITYPISQLIAFFRALRVR
ncbi:MAG: glycosyltransferase family 2 protein [bacterium]